jgi:uncharacterized RDD family membrane protein YckC
MEPGIIETRAARFSDRFVAYLFDVLPFGLGAAATVWIDGVTLGRPLTPERLAFVGAAWATLIFGYQLIGYLNGGTLGKRLLGLRVVSRDGGAPGFGRSLARALVWVIGSAGSVGFLVALFNRENRTLHDYVSGTVVVEARPKSAVEATALFLIGALGALGLFGFQIYSGWSRPTTHDRAAVAKANEGLSVIARVQDVYKETHGTYATSIDQLAEASGDPAQFRVAMALLFMPEPFKMEAGNRGWRIRALARDRKRTLVTRSGP